MKLVATLPLAAAVAVAAAVAAHAAPRKVLVVTATKGFRHSSIATAENVLATLGESSGAFTV
ncbi:MAG: ThuA domain-containing protein, partial [Verrucomicrobiota bacterium]